MADDRVRARISISGIVQGVGFRPALHRRAVELGVTGFVGNDGDGVFVEAQGPAAVVDALVASIPEIAPPMATVDEVHRAALSLADESGFRFVESETTAVTTVVPPDAAPCEACLRELRDPTDRRYRYPFLNCTDCGPRYSIVATLPYDRANTTMAAFDLCEPCRAEYDDPADRRFHAQPTCCPTCGPALRLLDAGGDPLDIDDVVDEVARRITAGAVVAVKGVGGFHLAVDATDEDAVARLRARKHRADKPFAVLVADLDAAGRLVELGPADADVLAGPARPIVLAPRRAGASVAAAVAPGHRTLGVLLPPSPLHVLLAEAIGRPVVLTSGNRSDEPIAVDDVDAVAHLDGIADAYCTHDRPIHRRVDDSVVRLVADRRLTIRRARGLAPRPIVLDHGPDRPTLGVGALLKSTVCVARGREAVLSPHLGDLDDARTHAAFLREIEHLCRLVGVTPQVVAHDLHPELPSTRHALDLDGVETVGVQHHHAHVASCLVDNREPGPVIGLAFDGLGFGTDGTLWGGEVLVADLAEFERIGHLRPVAQPGGDAAARQPWRMALAHAADACDDAVIESLAVRARNADRWGAVRSLLDGPHAPRTSSMGRLFDAVAALCDVRDEVSYEGQAAVELEHLADPDIDGSYEVRIDEGRPFVVDTRPLVAAVVDDVRAGAPAASVAARFHTAVVDLIVAAASQARRAADLDTVALTGGVFQNALLLRRSVPALRAAGFDVLTHRRIPPNDGGISVGQVAVAAARQQRER